MTTPSATPDATEIAERIRRREITALEAVDDAIARAEAMQPALNFLVTPLFDQARARAAAGRLTGPFAGVPYLLKDMYDIRHVPTRWGARFTERAPLPSKSCSQVEAFEAASLVMIGKSALSEFGWLPTTEPLTFGPTRNPWDLGRTPGGSSGGSAAAVAAGVVPMADAADGGGSIRIPASACGLFGLKPSRGRLVGDQHAARRHRTHGRALRVAERARFGQTLCRDGTRGRGRRLPAGRLRAGTVGAPPAHRSRRREPREPATAGRGA